ncbi:MAG: hypothetical protein RI957_625 [Verrucomicrobiota bacterium]
MKFPGCLRFSSTLCSFQHGGSSIGRASVSKTECWGFESLPPCHCDFLYFTFSNNREHFQIHQRSHRRTQKSHLAMGIRPKGQRLEEIQGVGGFHCRCIDRNGSACGFCELLGLIFDQSAFFLDKLARVIAISASANCQITSCYSSFFLQSNVRRRSKQKSMVCRSRPFRAGVQGARTHHA